VVPGRRNAYLRRVTTRRAALWVLVVGSLLTACSDGGSSAGPGPSGSPSPSAASPATTPSAPAATASPSAAPVSAPPFRANTLVDTETGAGGPLGLRVVRAAAQPGYDRVVFELGGTVAGRPGWRVEYVTRPASDGSGDPVAVRGSAYLQVVLTGVGYPDDTGVPEPQPKRQRPVGTTVAREVVLDGVFEGQYTAFVGLSAKRPFRVFRLSGPERVVIDVRHA
jgi:hypothetical protein